MGKLKLWMVLVLMAAWSIPMMGLSGTASGEDLRSDLNQAKKEIQELRNELAELKEDSSWTYNQELRTSLAKVPAASQGSAGGALKLPAGWSIELGGFFKFEMAYDDSAISSGDFIRWVNSEDSDTDNDDQINFTARQSRFGAKIFAPDIGDVKVMGRLEIDFYNLSGGQENKSSPLLRHAYGQLTGQEWSLIFGQTSDLISPLVPNTVNYTVGWWGGNIGYRHPQLRFTKWWTFQERCTLKVETALSRDIGGDSSDFGSVEEGQDASAPTVLSRVSFSAPCAGKKLEAGVSGHWGLEEYDWDYVGDDDRICTWSVNADLVVPLGDMLEFKGEFFLGENLDSYLGGIGQGVNTSEREAIESVGGWLQLGLKPNEKWAFHVGTGMDNPRDCDLPSGARSSNCFVFGNANYNFTKYLSTALELTYWNTSYIDDSSGDDFRIQHAWKLSF